jgi:hypothetical protein
MDGITADRRKHDDIVHTCEDTKVRREASREDTRRTAPLKRRLEPPPTTAKLQARRTLSKRLATSQGSPDVRLHSI